MNINPNAINVLCYGDSNTWGQKPDKSGRYPVTTRWTGRLQSQLGDTFNIIEEGLSSRTTDLEYTKKPGRNGKTYLVPCLVSQSPLDIVVLMLGTNDLKTEFDRSPEDIAKAIDGLISDIREYATDNNGQTPKILVVSPVYVDDQALRFSEFYTGIYDAKAVAKSKELALAIKAVADKAGCSFFDASTVAAPGEDGLHFSEAAHIGLATALEAPIRHLA
jgi:lysophospholipase L1-like esterase